MWPSAERTMCSARSWSCVACCWAISSTNSSVIGATEPKLTPMRIGMPRSLALRTTSLDILVLADVAGIEAQAVDAGVERLERQRVLEVDVGDQRHRRVRDDIGQRRRRLAVGHGDADDLAANIGQLVNLAQRRLRVAGVGGRHRLDDDGRAAADANVADVDGPCQAARREQSQELPPRRN